MVPKEALERIERWAPEQNQALEERWEKEGLTKEKKKEEKKKFEKKMRAKGKVKLGDEWVDPDVALKAKRLQIIESKSKGNGTTTDDIEDIESDGEENFLSKWWRKIFGSD
jgi:hypothetical protein